VSLIEGMNIVYDETESRGFIRLNLVALALTLVLMLIALVSLALVAILPGLVGALGLTGMAFTLIQWLRWPLLALVVIGALAMLYRFGPSRDAPQWRWVSWGAGLATLLWILGSIGFSLYVRNFADYNQTYGSLGAVIILLMWFWLSAFVVLMGAELDAEMEHQTKVDTTRGESRPMGERGAHVADTLGSQKS
jgi:membrane protein